LSEFANAWDFWILSILAVYPYSDETIITG